MLPDEIYASSPSQTQTGQKFKYSHPLNHGPVDDNALRSRLAYDLMTFMKNETCQYFRNPDGDGGYDPNGSDDEIDIMIVDGFYKEAEILLDVKLAQNPNAEKAQFQKAFIRHLQEEYIKLIERENKILASDPYNTNALINKGFALANLGREEEALALANKVLQLDPSNLIALGNKAYLAGLLGYEALREDTLKHAYNVSAQARESELQERESRLLSDMDSVFMSELPLDMPSAFDAFNANSGVSQSRMVH